MSAPRARRIIAAGVIATVLTAGSVGVAAAEPLPEPGVEALADEEPAGEDAPDEDAPDEDAPDEDAPDGDAPDEDAPDGEAPDGDAPDGDAPDGDAPDGDAPDGDAPDVVVVAPTVVDATIETLHGQDTEIDLDTLVTKGSGEIESIRVTPEYDLFAEYDADTHVLTVSPRKDGTFTVQFVATGLTPGANGQVETSRTGTVTFVVSEPAGPVASWAQTPAASSTSTTVRFSVNVDPGEYTMGYIIDMHPEAQSGSGVDVEGTTFEVTGLSVGRHTIDLSVVRGAGVTRLHYAWEVLAAAPVLAADAIPASVIRAGIKSGASGESVAIIQRVVGTPADGRFGAATRSAVIAFQRAHGLVADGIVGPLTWAAIISVANGGSGVVPVTATSIPAAQIARGISRGASGTSVAIVQRIVGADADGRFGPRTQAAVRAWQQAHGLVADGIVGRLTWAAMVAS